MSLIISPDSCQSFSKSDAKSRIQMGHFLPQLELSTRQFGANFHRYDCESRVESFLAAATAPGSSRFSWVGPTTIDY